MWTTENRARYDRSKLRYPSDLTDDEWALIPPARKGGNKRSVDVREVGQRADVRPEHGMPVEGHAQGTCRRRAPSTTICGCGIMTGRWGGMHHTLYVPLPRGGRP